MVDCRESLAYVQFVFTSCFSARQNWKLQKKSYSDFKNRNHEIFYFKFQKRKYVKGQLNFFYFHIFFKAKIWLNLFLDGHHFDYNTIEKKENLFTCTKTPCATGSFLACSTEASSCRQTLSCGYI